MKLNNKSAAEALLHLFNIENTWDEIEDLGPTYIEPLKSIVSLIKFVDKERAGELIISDPDPDTLRQAYDAGYRLGFTQSACKCCGTIDSMLHIVKPALVNDQQAELVMGSLNYAATWKELKKVVHGPSVPTYTLKEMGEMIVNGLSKTRAYDRNFCFEYGYAQHKDVETGFLVKKTWKLSSLNLKQVDKLQALLRESFREICGSQVSFKLTARPGGECMGILNFSTKDFGVESHSQSLVLDAAITTRSAKLLGDVDLQAIMDSFRRKVEKLPQDELKLTHQPGNMTTKDKYYTRFFWNNHQSMPEHLSKKELLEIIKAENEARAISRP